VLRDRTRFLFGLALTHRCYASFVFGAELRFLVGASLVFPFCRNARFLIGSTRFLFDLTLPLGSGASLFFGAAPRFLSGAALCLSLYRNASFLLTAA
jgi:hypothetical protein